MNGCAERLMRLARGGRLVKWKGQVASVAPSLLWVSVSTLTIGNASAEVISTLQDFPAVFNNDEDNTITSTGGVNLTIDGRAVSVVPDYSSIFTNDGTINAPMGQTGLFVQGEVLPTGRIVNNGTITVEDETAGFTLSRGIFFNESVGGAVINSGDITANAVTVTGGPAFARGVQFNSATDATAAIQNSGVISATARANSSGSASALGFAFNDVSTDIVNSGTISATAEDGVAVVAIGIQLFLGSTLNGDILNSGAINVSGRTPFSPIAPPPPDPAPNIAAVFLGGTATGNLTNSGSITARVQADHSVSASGFFLADDLNGNYSNSGSIEVEANSGSNAAIAKGFFAAGVVTGDLSNAGTSTIEADAASSATAWWAHLEDDLTGNITNSGTIEANANASSGSADAAAVYVEGDTAGNIANSGSITIRADATDLATAAAFYLSDDFDGDFDNSGTISVTSESTDGDAFAAGLYVGGTTDGDFANTGAIRAAATGAGSVTAAGVYIGDSLDGNFSNRGVISATASGGTADAFGLYIDDFDGVITDVGQISAISENGDAYAIFLGTGSGTLNIDSRDEVTGLIRVQDHNVNLDAQGGSAVFFFEDAAPGSGRFATTVSDGRSAWFVEDEGGSDPVYAVVDGADIATSDDVTAYYGSLIGRTTEALRYDLPEQPTRGLAFLDTAATTFGGFRPFAMIDAEFRRFENIPGIDTDLRVFNGVAGYSGQAENGVSMAIGLGVFRSDGDTDTTDFDTTGVYLDAAFGQQLGAFTVEGSLGFGWLSTDRTREIAGSPDARADFDSTLFTTHIGAERAFDVSDKYNLLGFGDIRYTRQDDDSYTETGSSVNASVDDATTEVIEARLGIEAETTLENGGLLIGRLSGVLRRGLGDTQADVTVFSDTQTLSFAATDFTGASVLVGYEHELPNNMQLEVTAEHEIGDAAQGPSFLAGLRWSF